MKTRPQGIALAFATVAALFLAGCSTGAQEDAPADTATRTVDVGDGPVEVPAEPARIAVLSGSLAGSFYALDAPVAGTDTSVLGVPPDGSGFPPTFAEAAQEQDTVVLSSGGSGVNLEGIAQLAPDLIVGGGQGITAVQALEVLPQLEAIAPTVLVPRDVTAWQDQLQLIAEIVGAEERVPALLDSYQEKLESTRAVMAVPEGPTAIYQGGAPGRTYMVPPDTAYGALLTDLGFELDDTLAKAPGARMVSTGDSFEISREQLSTVADAPNLQILEVAGPPAAELVGLPEFAQLPAVASGSVQAIPALAFRPDYTAVMIALDEFARLYPR